VSTLPIASTWFYRERFAHGITWLSEPHVDAFARCNIWHVRGRDCDLLVDTGLGVASLREAAADLLERPVAAVLTHSHFDHMGGAHEFDERWAHADERSELSAPQGFSGLTAGALGAELVERLRRAGYALPEQLLTSLPHAGYELSSFSLRAAPLTRALLDGDVIDLGDRAFEVLHLPGHSPGSIGLFEPRTRTLFTPFTTGRSCSSSRARHSPTTHAPCAGCWRSTSTSCTPGTIRASAATDCVKSPSTTSPSGSSELSSAATAPPAREYRAPRARPSARRSARR